MEGIYPVIINGQVCGKLKLEKAGAYTRFIAECPMQSEVIRLSVYGGGEEGYLGVPLPREGRLVLDKKLSPAAMREFPGSIDHCGLAGEKPEEEEKADVEEPVCEEEEKAEEEECRGEPECCGEDNSEEPECCGEEPECCGEEPECDCGAEDTEGPFWYATTDGALVSRDGEAEMVALPLGDERVPENIPGQPRIIEGKEYLVYITK